MEVAAVRGGSGTEAASERKPQAEKPPSGTELQRNGEAKMVSATTPLKAWN